MPDEVIDDPTKPPSGDEDHQESKTEKGGKGGGKEKAPDTETISKSELASLRRERDEARESEKFWADRARTNGKPEPVEEKEPADPEDPDPADATFVDDLTGKGTRALTDRGFLTSKATREMIRKEATKIAREIATETVGKAVQKSTSDQTIITEHPDLNDPESALYKETAKELRALVKLDPQAAKSPMALYAAARTAKATLAARAPLPKRNREEDDPRYEYQGDEDEAARRLRVASQGGERGRGAREPIDDDEIGPQARSVLAGMFPDKTPQQREAIFRRGQGGHK